MSDSYLPELPGMQPDCVLLCADGKELPCHSLILSTVSPAVAAGVKREDGKIAVPLQVPGMGLMTGDVGEAFCGWLYKRDEKDPSVREAKLLAEIARVWEIPGVLPTSFHLVSFPPSGNVVCIHKTSPDLCKMKSLLARAFASLDDLERVFESTSSHTSPRSFQCAYGGDFMAAGLTACCDAVLSKFAAQKKLSTDDVVETGSEHVVDLAVLAATCRLPRLLAIFEKAIILNFVEVRAATTLPPLNLP